MPGSPSARAPLPPCAPKRAGETPTILERLYGQHPNATTELDFTTPFELLVATILSAQSTDARVNKVTPAFFQRYPTHPAGRRDDRAARKEIEATGLFPQEGRSCARMAQALVEEHGGQVPADMGLHGLPRRPEDGERRARHALGVPGLPVDRHVLRVANRLAIAQASTPEEVERQLCAALPPERWTVSSDDADPARPAHLPAAQPLCPQCAW